MATDAFPGYTTKSAVPARKSFPITPHNSNEIATTPMRIYVGTGGDITLRAVDSGADVVYKNVANGVYLNVRPLYIRATGTSAADIIGEA